MTVNDQAAPVLVVRRRIAVPRERVFEAWLDSQSLAQWMRPMDFTHATVTVDPRVGGEIPREPEHPRASCGRDRPTARDELRRAQLGDDALEVGEREVLALGDDVQRGRTVTGAPPQLDHQADAVLGFRREDHAPNPTNGVGFSGGIQGLTILSVSVVTFPAVSKDRTSKGWR